MSDTLGLIQIEGEFVASFYDEHNNLVRRQRNRNRIVNLGLMHFLFGVFGGTNKGGDFDLNDLDSAVFSDGTNLAIDPNDYLYFGLGTNDDDLTSTELATKLWFDDGCKTAVRVNANASMRMRNGLAVFETGDITFDGSNTVNQQRFYQAGLFLSDELTLPLASDLTRSNNQSLINLFTVDYDNAGSSRSFVVSGEVRIGAL